jgi:4-amino-4-deoxy-L-arabinose transferase-like glycosyltransferase
LANFNTLNRLAASSPIIFVAAFATRLASAVYILSRYSAPQLLYTSNEPSHIAAAIAAGLGFSAPYSGAPIAPTAQQPPLYPVMLSAVFKVFGIYSVPSLWAAILINILAGAVTAVLLYHVGKRHFSENVGILASWFWVLPWAFQTRAFSVSLTNAYLAALGVTILFLWLPQTLTTGWRWLLFGIYSGLLVLLQPSILTIVVAYGIWLARSHIHSRRVLLSLVGLLLTLTPWTIRNYEAFGRFIPLRDNFGLELWVGNRPGMTGTLDFSGDFPDNDPSTYARLGELPFMDAKLAEAKAFIVRDPGAFIARLLRRIPEFWYYPASFLWTVLGSLGCLGAVLALWKDRSRWIWLVMLCVFPVVYFITHNFPIYRHPIEPVVILMAAYCVVETILPKRKRSPLG